MPGNTAHLYEVAARVAGCWPWLVRAAAVLAMAVGSSRRAGGGPGGPALGGGQAVRARVAARAMASMASAGLAASVTWQSVYLQMPA